MADIGAISAQQIIAGQTQKSKSNTKTTLDMNDFLSLIVKQLQNQDMTNPMDDAAMMNQMVQMDKLGMEVIPVPFRDAYPFGGGLHCSTADVYREGACQDYFPKQVGPTRLR